MRHREVLKAEADNQESKADSFKGRVFNVDNCRRSSIFPVRTTSMAHHDARRSVGSDQSVIVDAKSVLFSSV